MKSVAGRIVNLSSIVGSLTLQSMENSPIDPAKAFAYNASKTALNAYTIHLAHELKDTKIKQKSLYEDKLEVYIKPFSQSKSHSKIKQSKSRTQNWQFCS